MAFDSARAAAVRSAVADFLLGARRPPADGAVGLQPFVSLLRGHDHGREGVGPQRVQQEPRPLAERRDCRGFFQRVLKIAQPYLSDEHFTVDGTLIEAWA